MNNVFDWNRFLWFISKHAHENKGRYLWMLGAAAALIFLWFLFVFFADSHRPIETEMQIVTYYFGLAIGGCLYASLQFSDLASKAKGIHYLMLPASHLEKVLTALLYSVVVYFVCFTIVFYIVDFLSVNIFNAWSKSYYLERFVQDGLSESRGKVVNVFKFPDHQPGNEVGPHPRLLLQIYFLIQSAFLLGSVYFEKFSYIKTIISVLVIGFLIGLFIGTILYPTLLPPGNFTDDLMTFRLNNSNDDGKAVQLPAWFGNLFWYFLQYGITIVFWITTYFRLKEKEI